MKNGLSLVKGVFEKWHHQHLEDPPRGLLTWGELQAAQEVKGGWDHRQVFPIGPVLHLQGLTQSHSSLYLLCSKKKVMEPLAANATGLGHTSSQTGRLLVRHDRHSLLILGNPLAVRMTCGMLLR